MTTRRRFLSSTAFAAAALGCTRAPRGPAGPPPPTLPAPPAYRMVRYGRDRTDWPYDDRLLEDKRVLFDRINRDRAEHGVAPVRWDTRGARIGDLFCQDAALTGIRGHWDVQGRAPYLRWGLGGGVDYHSENLAAYSTTGRRIETPVRTVILDAQAAMMAETPPHDGHRRTILDPQFTHVGIGIGMAGRELRMTQEWSRVVFEWVSVPEAPVPARSAGRFAGQPPAGYEVGLVQIRYEPFPRLDDVHFERGASYSFPPVVRTLRTELPPGTVYEGGARGDFRADAIGAVSVTFPFDEGPGHYYVIGFLRRAGTTDALQPATAALVTAIG